MFYIHRCITAFERFLVHNVANKLKHLQDVDVRGHFPSTYCLIEDNRWDGNIANTSSILGGYFYEAWRAFDDDETTSKWDSQAYFHSGIYEGPHKVTTDLGDISGEYLHIHLPSSLIIDGYKIIVDANTPEQHPKNWVLIVYTDEVWTIVDDRRRIDTTSWSDTDTNHELTFKIRNNSFMTNLYRILITSIQSGTSASICNFMLLTQDTTMASNSLLQYNHPVALWQSIPSSTFSISSHNHDSDYQIYHIITILTMQISHNHDSDYADITHNHNDLYSLLSHNHDTVYSLLTHNHDTIYSLLTHNHSDDYASYSHVHQISEITNLQENLDSLNLSHFHELGHISDCTVHEPQIPAATSAAWNGYEIFCSSFYSILYERWFAFDENDTTIWVSGSAYIDGIYNHTNNIISIIIKS